MSFSPSPIMTDPASHLVSRSMRRRDLMRSALCLTGSASLLPLTGCGGGTASAGQWRLAE